MFQTCEINGVACGQWNRKSARLPRFLGSYLTENKTLSKRLHWFLLRKTGFDDHVARGIKQCKTLFKMILE